MGVDCCIQLPASTRLEDVQTVMSMLLGFKGQKHELSGHNGAWYWQVEGVKTEPTTNNCVPACQQLTWENAPGVKREGFVLYHFETRNGERLMLPRSTPEWIAIAIGLVDFFGGGVDFNDCDEDGPDYSQWVRWPVHPEDGEEWQRFQEALSEVKPLTREDVEKTAKEAAYR